MFVEYPEDFIELTFDGPTFTPWCSGSVIFLNQIVQLISKPTSGFPRRTSLKQFLYSNSKRWDLKATLKFI